MTTDFVFHKSRLMTPLSELPQAVIPLLQDVGREETWQPPNPITIASKRSVECDVQGGHYFMGGLPALMQAVRLLKKDPHAHATFTNDGELKKSTQSAHQGHVHPTEWTTPELGTWQLVKILLRSAHLLPKISPEDVDRYSYVHFPLSKIRIALFAKNFAYRVIHTLLSKNGVSEDDRWQCEAVRESLAFHKELSDEIEAAGDEATYASKWRLIWSQDKEGIERKRVLWNELGIKTEYMNHADFLENSLLKIDSPQYGLKVLGDGKFFPDVDGKIISHLGKKYPNNFHVRTATVAEVYIDDTTQKPIALLEVLPDGIKQTVAVDSFFGSPGHNQVFKGGSKKPLWNEVPVAGCSTLWVCTVSKEAIIARLGTDDSLISRLKQFVGTTNLTNLHMTIWDAVVENDLVHIIARATQGANFNSPFADPRDLYNMTANINRFFIGSWKLISAGSCTRKTATSNVPEYKDHFVHGLSGIGFSFSGAPKEILFREPLTANLGSKLLEALKKSLR